MSDFELVGAIDKMVSQGLISQTAAAGMRAQLRRPGVFARVPGRTDPGVEARKYCGLGLHVFQNAGATTAQLIANPQEPLGPARLVLARRDVGVASLGLTVTVTNVTIGTVTFDIAPGEGVPVELFAADSLANLIQGIPLSPGIQVVIGLSISAAPAAGESVTIGGALAGAAVA
jgi:hypothetical protein